MSVAEVHVRLLGAFEIIVDATVIEPFPTRRSRELVQLLALAPGHLLLRDQVIDALWPQLDPTAGGANLRKAAHHARQACGRSDAVELHGQQVALFPGAMLTTDVDEFTRAADAALADHDTGRAENVAGQYAGVLLPGARYEEWTQEPRRLLEQRHLTLLRTAGRWDLLLEVDPLDEPAAREVMSLALEAGQRHRAIAVYARLRSDLSRELGVLPDIATEKVYARCLDGLVPATAPFVGREQELATVAAVVRGSSGCALVSVRGPAGIGKSSFVDALVDRVRAGGGVAALVVADEPDDAFATLATLVEELMVQMPSAASQLNDHTRATLARLTPMVQGTNESDSPITRHQLLGALHCLIERAEARVVLVVDDAHRADESSLGVLAQLTERPDDGPVVIFTYRADASGQGMHRAIARAARHVPPITVDLGPLDRDGIRALASAHGASVADDDIETLAVSSQGSPFFAAELCRAGVPVGELQSPLADAISRRFLDLDDETIAWLRRLSIVSGPLELATIIPLTGCSPDELTVLLDTALAAEVLVTDRGQYRFGHELVRRTLTEQLPPHHAAAIHRDAARRLGELGARPGAVAHHWLEGGRPERAIEWLLRAAEDAIGLGGFPAAVLHLERIIEHDPDHAEALRRRAAALDAMGDPRVIAAFEDAVRVASTEEVHELRPLQALAMVKLGDPEGGMRVVEGAEPQRLESKLAKALAYCGAGLMGHADPAVGAGLAAEGRRLALRSGDPAAIVVASWAQAGAAHAQGELRASLHTDLHDTHSLPRLAVSVFDGQLCITQRLLYGSRPYDDVIRWAEAFAQEAERLGAARGEAFATTLRGEAELLSGRLDEADRDLRRGRQMHHDLDAGAGEAFSLQRLAELAGARGDLRSARRLLDESLAVARQSDVGFHLFDRIYGARIALAEDLAEAVAMVDEGEELVQGPIETCPGCRITLAVPAAIALAKAGELDRLAPYEASCEWLAEVVMQLPAWYAALDEVRGHRCRAEGDEAAAGVHFEAALRGFREAGQPLDIARCAVELG